MKLMYAALIRATTQWPGRSKRTATAGEPIYSGSMLIPPGYLANVTSLEDER